MPVANKKGGEAIRADDWNLVVGGAQHLADALSQMTQLVSPVGHNHPELEAKINEMSSNFDTLVNTLSAALADCSPSRVESVSGQSDGVCRVFDSYLPDRTQ